MFLFVIVFELTKLAAGSNVTLPRSPPCPEEKCRTRCGLAGFLGNGSLVPKESSDSGGGIDMTTIASATSSSIGALLLVLLVATMIIQSRRSKTSIRPSKEGKLAANNRSTNVYSFADFANHGEDVDSSIYYDNDTDYVVGGKKCQDYYVTSNDNPDSGYLKPRELTADCSNENSYTIS